jgi:hypothetical protein
MNSGGIAGGPPGTARDAAARRTIEAVVMNQPETAPASAAEGTRERQGVVLVRSVGASGRAGGHEAVTRTGVARRLAALKGFAFAGEHDPAQRYPGPVYLVPACTLVGVEAARALGIRGEDDLFGAVVPHAFVATKVITHPLVAEDAAAPAGWSSAFPERVRDAVLGGFSVFTAEDARRAGARLLERGPVRLKPVLAMGGRGQEVIETVGELEKALAAMPPDELASHGLVLEEDLTDVTTYSVGQVRVGALLASYWGTQRLTPDHSGAAVYGGSDLVIARGDFDALLALGPPPEARLAIAQARAYDAAAMACFPGLIASRRNYDVAQGTGPAGRRSGVLEQSWRIGGASGAEIAALEAFHADPGLAAVRASTFEAYGACEPPPHAAVYFRGTDEEVGMITKYALVEPHGHA